MRATAIAADSEQRVYVLVNWKVAGHDRSPVEPCLWESTVSIRVSPLFPLAQLQRVAAPPAQKVPVQAVDAFDQASAASVATLKRGSIGAAVEAWQDKLVWLGYMTRSQKASGPGVFGPVTEEATRQFQREQVSGAVGAATQLAMTKALASRGERVRTATEAKMNALL